MERMTGVIQPYVWGSPAVIPALLGVEPTGEPQAELWLGAHPNAPSLAGGRRLDAWVAEDPEAVVGVKSVERFGPRLPYLMKVLAADKPLSLQAHPSREQAEVGYAREQAAGIARDAPQRVYRDGWPKPEILCALADTEALCGFREPTETYALFEALGVEAATRLVDPLRKGGAAALEEVFGRLLRLDDRERSVVAEVAAAGAASSGEDDVRQFGQTAVELAEHYPGDPGVLAALLMNRLSFGRYDALFLPAGNLHAYLRGSGVELMANSDNVMRGGLTPKHIDIPELLSVLDFTPAVPQLVACVESEPGVWRYQTPAPEFVLWRLDVAGELTVPGSGSGRVLLVTDGAVAATHGTAELPLRRGQAAFLTAEEDVRLSGSATVFVGAPGVDGGPH